MIRYSLFCDNAHDFEGWFSGAADFDRQVGMGLVTCPVCGSVSVSKRLMAPSVSTARSKEAQQALVADAGRKEMMTRMREVVAAVKANSEDVGERFAEEARKIHYGESEQRGIIGQTSLREAHELIDEGIEIAPLPVIPDDAN